MNKSYLLIAFLVLMILILLAVRFFASTTTKPISTPLPIIMAPTSSPSPTTTQSEVGKKTSTVIDKRDDLIKKETLASGNIEYHYPSYLNNRNDLIVDSKGVVIFERKVTLKGGESLPLLKDYKDKLGEPEASIQGSMYYGRFDTTYIYASKGYAFIANPATDEIKEIQTYSPTTVEGYLKTWGGDINPAKEGETQGP